MTAASLIYEGAVRKSYYKLKPDSCKVKNNSPQFNVSLHVRFIRVYSYAFVKAILTNA